MDPEEFDYDLPEALIALRPASPRSAARLLVSRADRVEDAVVADLARHLSPGDLLVFNDTKVIPARLFGKRRRASLHGSNVARIETLLLERRGPDEWRAMARPGRRLAEGDVIHFEARETEANAALAATVLSKEPGGAVLLRFTCGGPALDEAIARRGEPPLPPYILSKRRADAQDREDYQTIFAEKEGAVAAPTAALHFDAPLMEAIAAAGIETTRVTLHVGAGTFLPPRPEDLAAGRLHAERGRLGAKAAAALARTKAAGRRVVAVGTTATRVLETAALAGEGTARVWEGATDLFIAPGFRFQAVDALMTNFHLPKSTLMMLVAAFVGRERMDAIYAHALREQYRFYSYGDASLLFPDRG